MLIFEHLCFSWAPDNPCLHDVTLQIASEEQVAIVGDNGAGKSTLLRLAAELLSPISGKVSWQQQALCAQRALWLPVKSAFCFRSLSVSCFTTGSRMKSPLACRLQKLPREEIRLRVAAALEECELTKWAASHPLHLDAGLRRMLAVACLHAMRPPCCCSTSRDFDPP